MPRKKVENEEEVKKVLAQLIGEERAKEISGFVAEVAATTGKDIRELLKDVIETGIRASDWRKLTAPDIVACVHLLSYVDSMFYRRIYALSPMEVVVEQADKYSTAVKKILESHGAGLTPIVETVIERKLKEIEGVEKQEKREQARQENSLLAKAIDTIVTAVSEELASRVSAEIAQDVAPHLKDRILEMIRKGEIEIRLRGEEIV